MINGAGPSSFTEPFTPRSDAESWAHSVQSGFDPCESRSPDIEDIEAVEEIDESPEEWPCSRVSCIEKVASAIPIIGFCVAGVCCKRRGRKIEELNEKKSWQRTLEEQHNFDLLVAAKETNYKCTVKHVLANLIGGILAGVGCAIAYGHGKYRTYS